MAKEQKDEAYSKHNNKHLFNYCLKNQSKIACLSSASEIAATITTTLRRLLPFCVLNTHTHTYMTRARLNAAATRRKRRLRREVVYSFSFSQNKMDCSLTKTVSRGTACAREQRLAARTSHHLWPLCTVMCDRMFIPL